MALPARLRAARLTHNDQGLLIDDKLGDLEKALCDILGLTIDVDITESPFLFDNSGRITKAMIRQLAVAPVGWRFRTSSNIECRIANDGTYVSIDRNDGTELIPSWVNIFKIEISSGIATFPAIPVGPASDPTTDNQFARKAYVDTKDALDVHLAGDQTVAGVKTFSSIPVLPASDPTAVNEATRKAYVDSVAKRKYAAVRDEKTEGTAGGASVAGAWNTRVINTERYDPDDIVEVGVGGDVNKFILQAGTYVVRATSPFFKCGIVRIRLRNTTAGTTTAIGPNNYGDATYNGSAVATLSVLFTIAAQSKFEIQYYCGNAQAADGLGKACSVGSVEAYTDVEIEKVA